MARTTPSLAVRALSGLLGTVGGLLPAAVLYLDDTVYEIEVFAAYSVLFGLPLFLFFFYAPRGIAWVLEQIK